MKKVNEITVIWEKNKFAVVEKQFEYKGHDCICIFNKKG